ncbi:hypothetical protein [Evansella tamaricis]|uniref:Uncharacterized protein n=1 Tax=Evansella tamaricis TaxID=2069301 RepID=A0ABS6JE18_9BACI|nr:hypothetical protein [Evansella tamaricis]MBU9711891.1 hypothetical protein [Evansella tamaricis]
MNWFLLILGIILLLLTIKGIAFLEKKKTTKSLSNEIKQNSLMVPLVIVLMFLITFIPYQIWNLFGNPVGWEILYIFGFSGVITIVLCFWFYGYQIEHKSTNEKWRY